MDEIENRQRFIEAAVSSSFGALQSQFRVQLEELHTLRLQLTEKREELQQCRQSIAVFGAVHQENEQLRRELEALQSRSASVTQQRRCDELEQERDALIRDKALQQTMIDSLRSLVSHEKGKSMYWERHVNSSPCPSVLVRSSSPHHHDGAVPDRHTSFIAGGVTIPSNETLLHKLVSPLENVEAQARYPSSSAAGPTEEEQLSTKPAEELAAEGILSSGMITNPSEHQESHVSFPDVDATCSHRDSSSDLPPIPSLHPQSSPGVRGPDVSRSPHPSSDRSLSTELQSDSTAPPSPSRPKRESNQEQLPQESSFDSLEVVSARPVGRKGQALGISAPDAKLSNTPVGNADDPITVNSEPPQSFRTPAENATGVRSTFNDSLGGKSFSSPKRSRDPQRDPPYTLMPKLQVAEDETAGADENVFNFQPVESFPATREGESKIFPAAARPRPLEEIRNGEQLLSRANGAPGPPSKKRKWSDDRGAAAIPIVAEDSEEHNRNYDSSLAKNTKPTSPTLSNTSAYRRLGNLLEGPSPARPVLAKPSPRTINLMDGYLLSASTSSKSAKKDDLESMRLSEDKTWEWYNSAEILLNSVGLPRPPQPEKMPGQIPPKKDVTALKAHHDPQPPLPASKRRLSSGPEAEEPFRSRPLRRLDLGHFKVNPGANAGIDYAYRDVVKGREQRKCLPGCIRPGCCGSKFRVLAGTLPELSARDNQFLATDRTDGRSSWQTDDDLLSAFLGPDSEERVRTLTPMARENLLLEAKTKIVADRYGKMHRHAHERPQSPPGFWRTEMPGTQEEAIHRLNAKSREREEVERRYREACKEDGRWMFADE